MLRPYQNKIYQDVREAFRMYRSVLMQLPTGAGKTVIFSEMAKSSREKGFNVWIIVPRNELLRQASDNLRRLNVPHGIIAPGREESRAYTVHVVSKDTLIRRYDKVKRQPEFIVIDEAHIALDRYLEISRKFDQSKILGVTATPERLDGRGLSELYETLVCGPSVLDLIEGDFLTSVKYFWYPIKGLEKLHRRGTEYSPSELDKLLSQRKIFGNAIKHYRLHADGRPAIVYCRSVQAAAETAQRFCDAGYRFENIDGTMTYKRRKMLIKSLQSGEIHGLTSCDLITYGLDVPRVECIIMLRPTLSRALFCQMVGRGLRTWPEKQECIILDHVGNLNEHGHPLQDHDWQFFGKEKRKRKKLDDEFLTARLCPEIGFLYCEKKSCHGCPYNTKQRKHRKFDELDVQLVEAKPVRLNKRPPAEQREYIDKINEVVAEFREAPSITPGPIGKMIEISTELGRDPMWVYHKLNKNKSVINISLLHEIARQKRYKPGWVWFQKKRILKGVE